MQLILVKTFNTGTYGVNALFRVIGQNFTIKFFFRLMIHYVFKKQTISRPEIRLNTEPAGITNGRNRQVK